jgi:hypothetical protein
MVGVEKAALACVTPRRIGISEMRVRTTNCNPMSAPADDPTIT